MVSTLFKVHDLYTVNYDDPFCATSTVDGFVRRQNGIMKLRSPYDRSRNHATYLERDLLKESVLHSGRDRRCPGCVQDADHGVS